MREIVLLAFVAWSLGCAGNDAPELTEAEIEQAMSIYEDQSCGVCHGEAGEGGDIGPALRNMTPYWDAERLSAYLRNPDGFRKANPDFEERRDRAFDEMEMPAYDLLSDEDSRALTRWLLTQ